MNVELTKREKVMFDKLKRGPASTDELLEELKKKGVDISSGHHAMTVSIKYLGFKSAQMGYIIRRDVGGRGRGNTARYSMRKEI